jgi:hypothetical protein
MGEITRADNYNKTAKSGDDCTSIRNDDKVYCNSRIIWYVLCTEVWYALKAGSKCSARSSPSVKLLPSSSTRMDTTIGWMHNNAATSEIQTLILRKKAISVHQHRSYGRPAFTTRNGVVNRGHAGVQRSVRKVKESRTTDRGKFDTSYKKHWRETKIASGTDENIEKPGGGDYHM